jgi:hypothetical protein
MDGIHVSFYAMVVSLMAMLIQMVFGLLNHQRAQKETDRQIAETKKQEKLHALKAEETYKHEVREWGRGVVQAMALAQQLCKIDPAKFVTSDYDLERAETVAALRGYLDRAKWLFPNLAMPSHDDTGRDFDQKRRLSALEAILHAYHVLDKVKARDEEHRQHCVVNMRNLRRQFVREMRKAVDPHVRGDDIERLMAEIEQQAEDEKAAKPTDESDPSTLPADPSHPIGPGEASVSRK